MEWDRQGGGGENGSEAQDVESSRAALKRQSCLEGADVWGWAVLLKKQLEGIDLATQQLSGLNIQGGLGVGG